MNTSIGAHLAAIHVPLYQVGAEDDPITPWRQTFRINGHVTGEKGFVLNSSGHILGIVNPVVTPPKRHFRVALADAPGTYVLEH